MKVFYASDLHVEYLENSALELATGNYDIAILAGDISEGTGGIEWAAERFDIPVIYVLGNHEYFNHDFHALQDECRNAARRLGVHLLERETLVIGGIRFAGCTLWTDYQVNNTPKASMLCAQNVMLDHHCITYESTGAWTPGDALQEHRKSVQWLQQQQNIDVVITHHVPSMQAIGHRHPQNEFTPAFISELDKLIEHMKPRAWVFGHHHCSIDLVHTGGARLLSNQHGYPGEGQETIGWDPEACFQL